MRRLFPHALAAVLPALPCLPMVLAGAIPRFCDPVTQAFPYHAHLARDLGRGELPLFNPYQLGGTSFIGNVQAGILYPPRLVLTLLFGDGAFALLLGIQLSIAGAATSLLAARLGIGDTGCVIAGTVFGMGGFLWGKLALPPVLVSASLLPVVILALDRTLAPGGGPLGLAFALALCLTSGHPQTILAILAAALVYAAGRLSPFRLGIRRERPARVATIAVALFATAYAAGAFTAGEGRAWFHPLRSFAWLAVVVAIAIVAAARGAFTLERTSGSRPSPLPVLGLGLVLGLGMATAQLLPVLEHLVSSREPPRPRAIEDFAVVDRAQLGLDVVTGAAHAAEESLFVGPVALLLAAMAVASRSLRSRGPIAILALAGAASYTIAIGPGPVRRVLLALPLFDLFPGLARYLVLAALALAVLAGAGADVLARLAGARVALVAALAIAAHLGYQSRTFLEVERRADLYPPLAVARPEGRFFSVDRPPELLSLDFDRPETAGALFPNLGMVYGLEDVQGYDPVHGRPISDLLDALGTGGRFPRGDAYHFALVHLGRFDLLRLFDVRSAIAVQRVGLGKFGFRPSDRGPLSTLWSLPGESRRAFVAASVVVENDPARALSRLDGAAEGIAFVQDDAGALPGGPAERVALDVARRGSGLLQIAPRAPATGLVVIAELWDRGWRATVDGKRVRPIRADGVLVGVPCSGCRAIELRYLPASFRTGLFAALASLTALAAIAITSRRRLGPERAR
ncbi:MAG: hypothetical protein U0166_04910 [Acidobacteriota bacterium]